MATTLPTVMVSAASPHSTRTASGWAARRLATTRRMRAANTAALEPVAMNAVTLVGAPS
jgi:hypothetical protein